VGKIVSLTYLLLDGVMENPAWTGPYFNGGHAKFAHGQLFASDALLLGRVTYEVFAASWPHAEESEGEFAVRMNTLPKHVVSTTLDQAEWANSSIVRGDMAAEVTRLEERYAKDILVYASGDLANSLRHAGHFGRFGRRGPAGPWGGGASGCHETVGVGYTSADCHDAREGGRR
jgi:dihydrofolate reductase